MFFFLRKKYLQLKNVNAIGEKLFVKRSFDFWILHLQRNTEGMPLGGAKE